MNGDNSNPGNSSALLNMFGLFRSDLSFKLLSYLGYGNLIQGAPSSGSRWWSTSLKTSSNYTQQYIQNNYVNLFPLLAYQKIYQDFFVGLNGKTLILLLIMLIILPVLLLI